MGIQEPPQDVSEALFVIKKGFSIIRPEEKQPLLIKFSGQRHVPREL